MKRSRTASLVVMGLSPLLLAGCDDTQKSQQVFTTPGNCTEAGVPDSVCEQAFYQATVQASHTAPAFSSQDLCAQQYDRDACDEVDDANSGVTWRPAMYGFVIGRVLRDGKNSFYPNGPVFHKRDDTYYPTPFSNTYSSGSIGAGGWRSMPTSEAAGEGDTIGRGGFGGEGGHGS